MSSGRVFFRSATQSGQIGLILLLMMVVMLTIGLSLVARTSKELKIATQETETTQVLTASETGINDYLALDLGTLNYVARTYIASPEPVTSDGDFINQVTVTQNINLDIPRLEEGAAAQANVTGGTALTVYWGSEICSSPSGRASLVVTIYGDTDGVKTAKHTAHAGCDLSGTDGIAFNTASDVIGVDPTGAGLKRMTTVALPPGSTVARIRPVYTSTRLHAELTSSTPNTQGYSIRSTGTSTRGDETRIVQLDQTLPIAPSVLDYVLLSGSTINK